MGDQVAFHRVIPSRPAAFQDPESPFPDSLIHLLASAGISRLYHHQAEAINHIRSGQPVVVATPTASGKSLIYHLPMLERLLENPDATALYLYPLKALAQDQSRAIQALNTLSDISCCRAAVYDGDVGSSQRRKIRENPPNILLSNPEMLHLSLLAHHRLWKEFLERLHLIVVDEVHTYRGVMGSHMAWVFRRLHRICRHYGAEPVFVCCSATVDDPESFCRRLTGLSVVPILESGAPQGEKHILLMNPVAGASQTAILLLKAALHRKLRTIVYTQSREMTEKIALWASHQAEGYRNRISAYRAGFLPEERREIEARLSSGELLAVISTSALELGIDIGNLDLCILVGYPGTIVSTWQRAGRVGRGGQSSALILIAGENALDQYFLRHPNDLLDRKPEAAVVNPRNPAIMEKHLVCAAAEIPLDPEDPLFDDPVARSVGKLLLMNGRLLEMHDQPGLIPSRKNPHREVDLRGTGKSFAILASGKVIGNVDGFRAFRETHPGAVYLHRGISYVVDELDLEACRVLVTTRAVSYHTRARGTKETEILEILRKEPVGDTVAFLGRLLVTDHVTGYETWRNHPHQKIALFPLDLPPQQFETEGFWVAIPDRIRMKTETRMLHFMGGIHAIEHAAIGMFPLLVMADRNDMGGISTPFHAQVGASSVFVYDAVPGGGGMAFQAFERLPDLLRYTHNAIISCTCENGCPSCVHSPKCGSGNRPIDKAAAIFILQEILKPSGNPERSGKPVLRNIPAEKRQDADIHPQVNSPENFSNVPAQSELLPKNSGYGVLDIETQRSAQEVGGWNHADRMGISCAVLYDSRSDRFLEFLEHQIGDLIDHLFSLERIVGFNIKRFDYQVLKGYSKRDIRQLETLDILEELHGFLGYRLSLDHLAKITLGTRKSGDGLQALEWWKQGKIREILDYCRMDVEITRDLYLFARKNGYLLFQNKADQIVRIPVSFP